MKRSNNFKLLLNVIFMMFCFQIVHVSYCTVIAQLICMLNEIFDRFFL